MAFANATKAQNWDLINFRRWYRVSSTPTLITYPHLQAVHRILIGDVVYSTVVCSCFRLAASVDYYHSNDSTYTIAPLSLWALAEMTCIFLVSCMPAAPKVFRDSKWIKKLLDMMKSLTRFSRKASTNETTSTWPHPNHHAFEARSDYHKLEGGDGLPLENSLSVPNTTGDHIELAVVPNSRS